jgi:ribose transport system substrate-binding protein
MRPSGWFVLPFVALSLVVTACGSNDSSAPSTSDQATRSPAQATVPAPPTRPPTSIQVNEALRETPPKGKKMIFLQCELPACARYAPGIEAATSALGWSAKIEVFKNADPGGALQQAINEHPDYIAITGIPAAALKSQLAAAKTAGIPVISCATPDKPSPGGYAVQCGGTLAPDADFVGRWAVNDSGGKAHLVAVTIPQFPVLNTETDWLKGNLERMCSGCKYDQLNLTIDDVASGGVSSKLIAFLQSHPDANYVYFTFNDLSRGVPEALTAAGFGGKVKLVGAAGDAAIMKTIGHDQNAWTIAPNVYSAWVMVDAMARLATGEALSSAYTDKVYSSPTWVVDSAGSAKQLAPTGYDWYGPQGFQEKFKALWKLGA